MTAAQYVQCFKIQINLFKSNDAGFGAVLNNSRQRHSIIILLPEEWVVGTKEKDSRALPPFSPRASHSKAVARTQGNTENKLCEGLKRP